ncbi:MULTISPECIES: hypothetical protein [unclassified Pseudoalteromonas]|uniref:hypothetical protein n=1 Tax=unclassified Pseudoalteromonas TaxID=194690 RepID=UPI0030145DA8
MKRIFIVVIAGLLSLQNSHALTLDDVDFSVKTEQDGFIYAPLKGTEINAGIFWYTTLKQDVTPPTRINPYFNKISIRAYPQAQDNGKYTHFVQQNNIIDERQNLIPTNAQLCIETKGLVAKLEALNLNYQLERKPSGYPSLCWLSITYLKPSNSAVEAQLMDYLNANNVLNHWYSIESTRSEPVYLDAPRIITDLLNENALVASPPDPLDNSVEYSGDLLDVVFYSRNSPAEAFRSNATPGESLSVNDWKRFMKLFSIRFTGGVQVNSNDVDQPIEISPSSGEVVVNVDTRANQ